MFKLSTSSPYAVWALGLAALVRAQPDEGDVVQTDATNQPNIQRGSR